MSEGLEKAMEQVAVSSPATEEKKPKIDPRKEKKLARQQAAAAAASAAAAAGVAAAEAVCNPDTDAFGTYPLIQSQTKERREWTEVDSLTPALVGQNVWLRARVHNVRGKGNSAFVVLRRGFSTAQGACFKNEEGGITKDFVKFVAAVPCESMVDIYGTVTPAKVETCTQKEVELQIKRFYVISRSASVLPFNIEDAARPEAAFDAPDSQYVRVNQDTRLDFRWIDIRTPANHAIFRIQSMVCLLFREYLLKQNFVEIHTPKIIGAASEGGAAVFRLSYFDRPAFLAQSPQLYKQMAICSDLERVFEIGPVFRSENANTHRHLCEFVGLDLEMAFKEHYYEVLDVIDGMFLHIFNGLNERCQPELAAVNQQYAFAPLRYRKDKSLRIPYVEGIRMLQEAGQQLTELEDINTEQEKLLGRLIADKYGVDFYIMDKFPADARPFYTMPDPTDPRFTNSYDIYVRGEEIVSGSQRIHDPELLTKRAIEKNMRPDDLKAYIDSFRHGAPPHAGCGVGLERVVMLFLGLGNIRKSSMFPRDPRRLTP